MIQSALDETRKEIKQSDLDLKAGAVLKLVYVSPAFRSPYRSCARLRTRS